MFDNYSSISIRDLLTKPTIIELSAIENSDEKTLLIMLLLLYIQSYINANYIGEGVLKNIILLEEAHVIFDATSSLEKKTGNTSDVAKAMFKRLLAEARAYGVGMIVADQSPRKVTADVIGLTDIKTVFRLVEEEDKTIISDSISMSEQQKSRLSRLRPGELFFYYNKLEEPEELSVEDYREKNSILITISDNELSLKSTYWSTKKQILKPI